MNRKVLKFIFLVLTFGFLFYSKQAALASSTCISSDQPGKVPGYSTYVYYVFKYDVAYIGGDRANGCKDGTTWSEVGPYQVNDTTGKCTKKNGGYSSCTNVAGPSRCGVLAPVWMHWNSLCNNYYTYDYANSDDCSCHTTSSCTKPATPPCSSKNRCGTWKATNSCGSTTNKCGSCGSGYSCVLESNSNTSSGGDCVKDTSSCTTKTCADIGADGTDGAPCDNQHTACSINRTCGGCNAGLKCTGKDANGYGGTCTKVKTPADPTYNVTVMVFYDRYGGAYKKGSEPTYNNCYPATSTGGAGATSGSVSVFVDNKDTGVADQTESYVSYKNCKTDGSKAAQGYSFTTLSNTKVLKLTVPTGYSATGYNYSINGGTNHVVTTSPLNKTVTLSGDNIIVRFGVEKTPTPATPQVSGRVFIDDDGDGQYEPGPNGNNETCFDSSKDGALSIKVGSTPNPFSETTDCTLFSYDNTSSPQTVKLSTDLGAINYEATGYEYQDATHPVNGSNTSNCYPGDSLADNDASFCLHDSLTDGSESVSLGGDDSEVDFGVKPITQTYTVSGTIYVGDSNTQGSSPAYSGGQPKTISAIYTNTDNPSLDGTVAASNVDTKSAGYTLSGLPAGDYLIEYSDGNGSDGPPSGYTESYPSSVLASPPTFLVGVGAGSCYIKKASPRQTRLNDAACSAGGDITGLNFGITNAAVPWFQSVGGDMRIDSDLTDALPSGQYASVLSSSPSIDPGIVITDQASAHLGSGTVSTKGWLSLSNTYIPISNGTRASYEYLNSTITRGGITPTALFAGGPCGSSSNKPNCTLPSSNFPGKVYTANSGLTIQNGTYTFTSGNYIFLVSGGDINIQGNIIVNPSATVVFATTGNINVVGTVTEIDGIYSADGQFITAAGSSALKVYGAVIANANLGINPGSIDDVFNNNRDLGAGNANTPSVSFIMRPDFILNLPGTVRIPNYVIQEVAPGPGYSLGQ